jgi:hypothetical protein
MRSSLKTFIAVAAALLVVPSFASANDVGDENGLQDVISRLSDLEQQLQATNDALAASNAKVDQQQQMLSKFEPSKQSGPMLALSDFLTETTFGGWVAGSYFYNTNNLDNGSTHDANQGMARDGLANRYHGDSNSFHVDEVWFEMSNEATPESRGGFQFDVLMGETADVLCDSDSNGSSPCVYNANVSYLAPITDNGIEITAGRFASNIGAERPGATYNFNITQGLVRNLQPINHTGVKIASSYDGGLDWMLGISNTSGYEGSGFAQQTDFDDEKVFLWRVGYQMSDTMAIGVNGLWGGNCALSGAVSACTTAGRSQDKQGIVDVVLNWDPSDQLSTWVNVDWIWTDSEVRVGDSRVFGIAAAGRYAVSDATGFSLRGEYVRSTDDYVEVVGAAPLENQELWSITGTIDHTLTDHVSVKAEVVYQEGSANKSGDDQFFANSSGFDSERQVLLGAQMIYEF